METFSPNHFKKIHKKFNEAFSWMPLAAVVGQKILCVHGGISPRLTSWEDIRKVSFHKRSYSELFEFIHFSRLTLLYFATSRHCIQYFGLQIKRPLKDATEDPLATDLLFADTLDFDLIHIPTRFSESLKVIFQ